jgi:autophagy-related protein 13
LADWKAADATHTLPPPLCIEIYLDLQDLNNKQTLVINDDNGKRWDVAEILNQQTEPADRPPSRSRLTQVVLERWRVEVQDRSSSPVSDLRDPLPNVYKKAVVLFRSLYTYTRFLPAWRYYRRMLKQPPNQPGLKLNYRITNDDFKHPRRDTLKVPF